MAQAVKRLYPNVKLTIGPAIEDGFYYDFDTETPFAPDDLEKIESEMKKIVKEGLALEKFELAPEDAIKMMQEKDEPYKVELIKEHAGKGEKISFYKQGEFTELCAGPHLMDVKPVKAFKLTNCTGAYWRGDAKIRCFAEFTARHSQKHQCLRNILPCLKRQKSVITESSARNLACLRLWRKARDFRSSFPRA